MNNTSKITGLTSAQVEQRKAQGLQNSVKRVTTKSYKHIFMENIFSLFNFINLAIFLVLVYLHSIKNCMFMFVVLCNTCIGIVQEIRSKRIIDKLSIINQSKAVVIRDGKKQTVDISEIVKDDIVLLTSGCQVSNDCTVIEGACEVNESLITGESDSIYKNQGSSLLSGSYIVSGKCCCKVDKVGKDNYAESILGQIKYVKKTNSEIVRVIKRIIVIVSICIVPFAALLFYNQYNLSHNTFEDAVINSAAAIIGMIPEGLVLLISTVFALGVIRLSKKKVLSQDLYSLESLARTDVLCLDKTGTITTGSMTVEKLVCTRGVNEKELEKYVQIIASASPDNNPTIMAIKKHFKKQLNFNVIKTVPFSSDRKWSAVCTKEHGTIIMGAGEMLFKGSCDYSCLDKNYKESFRVVTVAHSDKPCTDRELPDDLTLVGFILMSEEVRESINETFEYFRREGVEVKIISGDNPDTVRKLCGSLLNDSDCKCVDMSKVSDEDIPKIAEENSIFGRVTPKQKKLIVAALKSNGHTVGMVGDGVNDVLALKESDCSIGLANGSEAARNVSQLVLLNSDFRSLPSVVVEGRRSINNLQNSSSLFLSKTIFSAIMSLVFMFIEYAYPFQPIQITLISALTIGMPSFILSFEKNTERISGKFILNVVRRCLPAAITNIFVVVTMVLIGEARNLSDVQISTVCVLVLAVTGLLLIIYTYRPLTPLRVTVMSASIIGMLLSFFVFNRFFGLTSAPELIIGELILACAVTTALFLLLIWLFKIASSGKGIRLHKRQCRRIKIV